MSYWDSEEMNQKVNPAAVAGHIGNMLNILSGRSGSDPIRDLSSTATTPTETQPAATDTGTASPVDGDITPSGSFGEDRGGHIHAGLDLPVASGTPVKAMRAGTVIQVVGEGDSGGYGNEVVVDHGNGLTTRYAHLTNATVTVGDKVTTGGQVGVSGSTGDSTGPHLHFEVMEGGQAVDPAPYLAGSGPIATPATPTTPTPTGDVSLTRGRTGSDPIRGLSSNAAPATQAPATKGTTTGADDDPAAIDSFLAATKQHESGGDYTIRNTSGLSNASGAYQFIGTTWGGYGGYASAAEAPPEVQDAKAREMASQLFAKYHSWRLVAIAWYGGPGIADQVAAGKDPGAPDQQGGYLAYGDTIARMMGGGRG